MPPAQAFAGANIDGRLGEGSTTNSAVPVAVSGGGTWSAVTIGGDHTCGLKTGGALFCWGEFWRDKGRVSICVCVCVGGEGESFFCIAIHTCNPHLPLLPHLTTPTNLHPRPTHTPIHRCITPLHPTCIRISPCVRATDHPRRGSLPLVHRFAGDNQEGELGDGTTANSAVPVAVSGSGTWSVVSAGWRFTCGLKTGGALFCWGGLGWNGGERGGGGRGYSGNACVCVG